MQLDWPSYLFAALGTAAVFLSGWTPVAALCAGILLLGLAWHSAGGRMLPARLTAPARRRRLR